MALAAKISKANNLADRASRFNSKQEQLDRVSMTTPSFFENKKAIRNTSTAYDDSRSNNLTVNSVKLSSRFHNGGRNSPTSYISIKSSHRSNSKKGNYMNQKDSKRSLHEISIAADPSRAGSSRGGSIAQQSDRKSILGKLSVKTRNSHASRDRTPRVP